MTRIPSTMPAGRYCRQPAAIAVKAGVWRIRWRDPAADSPRLEPSGTIRVEADLFVPGPRSGARIAWSTAQPSIAGLEEQLGWAIPLATRTAINTFDPRARIPLTHLSGPTGRALPAGVIHGAPYRPASDSLIGHGGQNPTRYGQLLTSEPIARRWRSGPIRVELIPDLVTGTRALLYRVSATRPGQQPDLIYAGVHNLPRGARAGSNTTLHRVVREVLTREPTPRQQAFLTCHGDRLTTAVEKHLHPPASLTLPELTTSPEPPAVGPSL